MRLGLRVESRGCTQDIYLGDELGKVIEAVSEIAKVETNNWSEVDLRTRFKVNMITDSFIAVDFVKQDSEVWAKLNKDRMAERIIADEKYVKEILIDDLGIPVDTSKLVTGRLISSMAASYLERLFGKYGFRVYNFGKMRDRIFLEGEACSIELNCIHKEVVFNIGVK